MFAATPNQFDTLACICQNVVTLSTAQEQQSAHQQVHSPRHNHGRQQPLLRQRQRRRHRRRQRRQPRRRLRVHQGWFKDRLRQLML